MLVFGLAMVGNSNPDFLFNVWFGKRTAVLLSWLLVVVWWGEEGYAGYSTRTGRGFQATCQAAAGELLVRFGSGSLCPDPDPTFFPDEKSPKIASTGTSKPLL